MNKNIFIRKAKKEDAFGIHQAHMESILTVCKKDYTEEQLNAWGKRPFREESRIHGIENGVVFVVERDQKVEGYIEAAIEADKAYLYGLYITQRVLGKGYGQKLFMACLNELQFKGIKEMELNSTVTALGFYQKNGFAVMGEMVTQKINGVPIPCYLMKKSLV